MTTDKVKRKLTAILSADVKGYSRLMGEDEEWTLRTLNTYKEVMGSFIQQYRGRIVGTAGDSVLAEFASVVDAVQCGVEIQQVLRAKNALLPETRRMEFRIGINLGDVIEEGDTIYGDGVNIAARLEGIAEPGGICISESAYQQIENKLPLRYDYLGEHEVKNIAKPVRVYRARIEPEATPSKLVEEKKPAGKGLSRAAMIIIAIIVIAGGTILYQFVIRPSPSKTEVASKEKMAFPLPDVPSIAVLPFVNMSEDPKQEFLCDGMAEEIITALSKVRNLLVISRQSSFSYKGKPVKVKQVSEELGVRYVLEGSVQRSADRVRITAQLIDALTGNHLWAERYERDLKDIFALQDEITLKILIATQVKLTGGAEETLRSEKYFRGKQGLDCWLKIWEGYYYAERFNIGDNNLARRIVEEVIAMCPEVPGAYRLMALVHQQDYWLGNTKSPRESTEKAIEMIQKALALDESSAQAHAHLGYLYTQKREYDKGIAEAERALALSPSDANVIATYAMTLDFACRSEEAIPLFQKAIRLNPFGPAFYYHNFGNALFMTGRFEEAVSAYKKVIQRAPNNIWAHMMLAATYINMGREQEARAEAAELLRINPKFSLDFFAKTSLYKEQSVRDNLFNALQKAGLK
jgi:adenylate cyclase